MKKAGYLPAKIAGSRFSEFILDSGRMDYSQASVSGAPYDSCRRVFVRDGAAANMICNYP